MNKLCLSLAFALLAVPAFGQTALKLDIRDGNVNLDATSVPARQILAEWARIGGTKVVGAEKIAGTPLTLKLENMPERQALDIILRNVAGYMAAPRRAAAVPGLSAYDRIVILPTSAAPAAATANANVRMPANPGAMAGTERRVPPRPPGMIDPDDVAQQQEQPAESVDNAFQPPPVFTFPQPQVPGNANSVFVPVQQGGFGVPQQQGVQPQITLQPGANGQPTIYNFAPPSGTPPAGGGFTVIGSPTPGMVQQPAPTPGQPVPVPPKPPGGN
jgi:hypothetical protein